MIISPTGRAQRRRTIVLLTLLWAVIGLLWGLMYLALGMRAAALVPGSFGIVMLAVLVIGAVLRTFEFIVPVTIPLVLALPLTLQMIVGGAAASGDVMLWAILAPMIALVFYGLAPAVVCWGVFALLTVVVLAFDPHAEDTIGIRLRQAFFAVNAVGVGAAVVAALGYYVKQLHVAHAESERLLLNVLPAAIAERLKRSPAVIADGHAAVSVLFADIVGFTTISTRKSPSEIVAMLNHVFSRFDELAADYGLEKIKTIGDAYMVVAGLPEPRDDHQTAIADMALEMQRTIAELGPSLGESLQIRIGIHTGPVVAGVIGIRKFVYDLWGDTVNTASRMESHGTPGTITMTAAMSAALGGRYATAPLGTVDVKGKGPMDVYRLLGRADADLQTV